MPSLLARLFLALGVYLSIAVPVESLWPEALNGLGWLLFGGAIGALVGEWTGRAS